MPRFSIRQGISTQYLFVSLCVLLVGCSFQKTKDALLSYVPLTKQEAMSRAQAIALEGFMNLPRDPSVPLSNIKAEYTLLGDAEQHYYRSQSIGGLDKQMPIWIVTMDGLWSSTDHQAKFLIVIFDLDGKVIMISPLECAQCW